MWCTKTEIVTSDNGLLKSWMPKNVTRCALMFAARTGSNAVSRHGVHSTDHSLLSLPSREFAWATDFTNKEEHGPVPLSGRHHSPLTQFCSGEQNADGILGKKFQTMDAEHGASQSGTMPA